MNETPGAILESKEVDRVAQEHTFNPAAIEEIRDHVMTRIEQAPTEERKKVLTRELFKVLSFFDQSGIRAFVAGGAGIDLLDAKWDRDHQDLDVAIRGNDREAFFISIKKNGFHLRLANGTEAQQEDVLDIKTHNAFASRTNEAGETTFEVIFLNVVNDDDVELSNGFAIPMSFYENAPMVEVAEKEIRLQPTEVILFHKLIDARRKDLRDIINTWGLLSVEQQQRLQSFVDSSSVTFMIDGEETSNIPFLLEKAFIVDSEKQESFFRDGLESRLERMTRDLMSRCEEIYLLAQNHQYESFLIVATKIYGQGDDERQKIVQEIGGFLLSGSMPDLHSFKKWALKRTQTDAHIKDDIFNAYANEEIYQTKKVKTSG